MSETWCSNSAARRIAPIRSRQNVTMKRPTMKQSVTMRTHVGTMASLTLAILLAAPSHGVAKQLVPAQFQGVWQNMEGKTGVCKQADWGTAAQTDTHIRISPESVDYHETQCRYTSIPASKADSGSGAIRLTLACRGEGETWSATEIWQLQKINEQSMLLVASPNSKHPYIFAYQQCVAAGNSTAPSGSGASSPANAPPAKSIAVASLPLQRGYYVASGTSCDQASNATLQLLRRGAIGAARTLCEFKAIEQTGPTSYRVRESCSELGSTTAATETVSYEIANDRSFTTRRADGADYNARYCVQSSLPSPWRDNDIRGLIK
ncbi:hypothetical protein B2M20_02655 [Nitrobacter vulgaris]|uniref:Uncharacterized protein n=2 Tax=Nitrobacter vulgaris TaxID=29421 RepID=A0A1V4I1U5_NITVU|nr:hypothetical protein B2M20_02655 [Nitrobacter vulgaris]